MTIASITTWVVLIALLLWAINSYNRLVRLKNQVANAFGQIDVQLKRRYDLVPNLVEAAKKYLQHERATLEAVIAARQQAVSASQAARQPAAAAQSVLALAAAETALDGALGRLFAVAEAYPDLKADATIQTLTEELTSTENKIAFARQAYNDGVMDYNNVQAAFPDLLVARLGGFGPLASLQSTESPEERKPVRIQM